MKIIFSTTDKPLSRIIRWFERWDSSHISILYDDNRWMMHSSAGGVKAELWLRFSQQHKITHVLYVAEHVQFAIDEATERNMDRFVKAKYDEGSLFGFVFFRILTWLNGFRIGRALTWILEKLGVNTRRNIFNSENDLVCVEYVNELLADAGVSYEMPRHISLMGLRDTYTNLLQYDWITEEEYL